MAKKQYKNYDDTLVGRYIRHLENPDSIGYNSTNKIWTAPTLPGYDTRNRGMGVDVYNNEAAITLSENRPGRYLTEEEERLLRNKHIDYSLGAIKRHDSIPSLMDMSPRKEAEVVGAIYRGDANRLWDSTHPLGKALRSPNEEDFHKAIEDYYTNSVNLPERAKNNAEFWKQNPQTKPIQQKPAVIRKPIGEGIAELKQQQELLQKIKKGFPKYQQHLINKAKGIVGIPAGTGGRWAEGGSLQVSPWDSLSITDKATMMNAAINQGIYDLPTIKSKYNEFAEGGDLSDEETLYKEGGYKPSEGIKKRITKWEGSAMTGAIDPLSGKWAKNNSFEAEARGFYNALPASIREQVLSNQDLADNLYSYSYNVGSGNFRKRVVPTLENYYKGKASIQDIQNSMWASGDKKLRGLRRRRAEERAGVGKALGLTTPETLFSEELYIRQLSPSSVSNPSKEYPLFMPGNPEAFFGVPTTSQESVEEEVVAPVVEDIYSARALAEEERRNRFNTIQSLFDLLNQNGENNSALGIFNLLNNSYGSGGKIHIKPENRGKFTALKKRTGHSATWFKQHGTPAQKKMATFALNAKKWKH